MTPQMTSPTEIFSCTLERAGGELIVRLGGELDAWSSVGLAERVTDGARGAAGVTLDTAELSFCDTAGLRTVAEIARQQGRRGKGFTLATPRSASIERLIDITGCGPSLGDLASGTR